MGRQVLNRDTRTICVSIDRSLFNDTLEVQARLGCRTLTETVETALRMLRDSKLGPEIKFGPEPARGRISLALDDTPISANVPEQEATEIVDQPVSKDKDHASIQDILVLAQGIKVDK